MAGEYHVTGVLGLSGHGSDCSFQLAACIQSISLWRLDTTREKLEAALKELIGPGPAHAQLRAIPPEHVLGETGQTRRRPAILEQLQELRLRCQRQTSSLVTPMGDEIYYRYQQSMIDEAITTLVALFQRTPDHPPGSVAS